MRGLPLLLLAAPSAFALTVNVEDAAPYHVHEPGLPFVVHATVDQPDVTWQWVDFRGKELTAPESIAPGERTKIPSPAGEPGFYGLKFSFPEIDAGRASRSFGFLVARTGGPRVLNPDSRMGMCKPRMAGDWPGDLAIDPRVTGWIKSLGWENTGARFWKSEIDRRRRAGLEELPLVEGGPWASDDTQPISSAQVAKLRAEFLALAKADPTVSTWELGREENLSGKLDQPFYFENLAKKARACADAARQAGVRNFRAVYDIADAGGTGNIERFLASPAGREFQILSLHPYPWRNAPKRDFPDPDTWLAEFLDHVRAVMKKAGRADMPLWFTEAGAPVQETADGVPFGYAPYEAKDNGLSRTECASYLAKLHAIASAKGVEKIFWYEHGDSGSNPKEAEHVFGLVDSSGFPRPSYAAYAVIGELLANAGPDPRRAFEITPGGARVCTFRRVDASRVVVAWAAGETKVPAQTLSAAEILEAFDTDGRPLDLPRTGEVALSDSPRFFVTAPSNP